MSNSYLLNYNVFKFHQESGKYVSVSLMHRRGLVYNTLKNVITNIRFHVAGIQLPVFISILSDTISDFKITLWEHCRFV